MSKVNVFNQTASPVQVDDEGRSLGGRERDRVENTERVKKLIVLGYLVEMPEEKVEADADATSSKKKKEGN